MIIPKKDRVLISKYLFDEGVLVAKKDFEAPKHSILATRNLYVIKLMQSYKSRGYVRETFSWQWYYWYLTNEGIQFLREYLHLTEDVVPATLNKPKRPARLPGSRPPRSNDDRSGKKGGAPSDFKPSYGGSDRWNRSGSGTRGGAEGRPTRVGRGAGAAPATATPSE